MRIHGLAHSMRLDGTHWRQGTRAFTASRWNVLSLGWADESRQPPSPRCEGRVPPFGVDGRTGREQTQQLWPRPAAPGKNCGNRISHGEALLSARATDKL